MPLSILNVILKPNEYHILKLRKAYKPDLTLKIFEMKKERFFAYHFDLRLHQEQIEFIRHLAKFHQDKFNNASHVVRAALNHYKNHHKKECETNGVKTKRAKNSERNGVRTYYDV